jgi:hypothetical protein
LLAICTPSSVRFLQIYFVFWHVNGETSTNPGVASHFVVMERNLIIKAAAAAAALRASLHHFIEPQLSHEAAYPDNACRGS